MRQVNAFILAAGRGERLRPITDYIAKPMLPVLGRPVLERVLERLSGIHVENIGINVHHKADDISAWAGSWKGEGELTLFREESVLGTGGALMNAAEFLRSRTFLVHNADVLSTIDLRRLIKHHHDSSALATLAVHKCSPFNVLRLDDRGFLQGIESRAGIADTWAFTGVAVYEPEFLTFLPGGSSSVVQAWMNAVRSGHPVGSLDVSGSDWFDIGMPSSYARAVFNALRDEGETVHIHPSIRRCPATRLQGYVSAEEGCTPGTGVLLCNCILLPGSRTLNNAEYRDCIVGKDFKIDIGGKVLPGLSDEGERQLIGAGGSDRRYFRIDYEGKPAVLMECVQDNGDYERHMEYTDFFFARGIPVPKVLTSDSAQKTALLEDAGDISLYSWLKCPRIAEEKEAMYRAVLKALVWIHAGTTVDDEPPASLAARIFSPDDFRWETEYFLKHFVSGLREMTPARQDDLLEEFQRLAGKAGSFSRTIIHRDFQSQNILIMDDGDIRIIDYQGARMGPPAYDIASILWDPYHRLDERMRDRLVEFYMTEIRNRTGKSFDEEHFFSSLLVCRLQRHMQALGAFGFLSAVKGKKYFLKYVPEGLRLLYEDVTVCGDEFPVLHDLVMRLREQGSADMRPPQSSQ